MNTLKMESASGKEVSSVINLIGTAVIGVPMTTVMMACLVLILVAQYPDITPEQLEDGIEGSSEWIAHYIQSIDGTKIPRA